MKKLLILLFVAIGGFSSVVKSENVISPIMGAVTWDDDTFQIDGNTIVLDSEAVLTRGLEFNHAFESGLRLGGQAKYYELDVISNSNGSNFGYVDVIQVNATVAYHAPISEYVQPFFGMGMGSTRVGFNGGTSANLDGETYVGKMGLEIKMVERVDWIFSAQSTYFKAKNSTSRMESHTNEYYMGVSIAIGSI